MLPVYVIHVSKGYEERARSIRTQMEANALDFEFILEHDCDTLSSEFINAHFAEIMSMPKPATSCAAKHIEAWKKMESQPEIWFLVLEDDILLHKGFRAKVNEILKEAQVKGMGQRPVLISLENSGLRFVPSAELKKDTLLYPALETRCTGAYLINRSGAKAYLKQLSEVKMDQTIDWWMGAMARQACVDIFWAHPTIAEQGSHSGVFASAIDHKPKGVLRRLSWNIQRIYKMYFRRR
jgi:GR25 family glycosyltransferase involved in LPS biosynthesis